MYQIEPLQKASKGLVIVDDISPCLGSVRDLAEGNLCNLYSRHDMTKVAVRLGRGNGQLREAICVINDGAEGERLELGEIGEHLSVELDVSSSETVHETGVVATEFSGKDS